MTVAEQSLEMLDVQHRILDLMATRERGATEEHPG